MSSSAARDLLVSAARAEGYRGLLGRLQQSSAASAVSLSGLTFTAKALYLTLLQQELRRPLVVITDGNRQAESLTELLDAFHRLTTTEPDRRHPQLLPALDVVPNQRLSPHPGISRQRAIGLWRLATEPVPVTIVPVAAALLRTSEPSAYRQLPISLQVGDEIPREELLAHLTSIGYTLNEPVEHEGEYSMRGGVLDVFPAESSDPVRFDLFGDTIEEMRRFDPDTQRSVLKIEQTTILPIVETPCSREVLRRLHPYAPEETPLGQSFPGWEFFVPQIQARSSSIFALVNRPLLVLDEPERIASAAERFWTRLEDAQRPSPVPLESVYFSWDQLREQMGLHPRLELTELEIASSLETAEGPATSFHIAAQPTRSYQSSMQAAVSEGKAYVEQGGRTAYFAAASGELERLADILQEYGVGFQTALAAGEAVSQYLTERSYLKTAGSSTFLIRGLVRRGVVLPESGLFLLGSEDLFGASEDVASAKPRRAASAAFQADIADLKPGDYVVHETHGVGKFLGIRAMEMGGTSGDFMIIEYAGESKLYLPLSRVDLVQKYRGAGEGAPSVDKLGGVTWAKTKSRVRAKMRDMADELLKLYAQRKMSEGFAFSPDSNWQREFEDAFEYNATNDQLTVVREIKRDMESETPMDRLLCGDVGFGKTEVAMRAAFKALGDGKQVAVLAPTTVLTLQHYESFKRRFSSFPVKIDMLSRFRSAKEIKATIEEIGAGKVDVVIGTHRILSKDVQFRDLGLLIVDEEQRFGVAHKERLKQIRHNVDVLTMSATPIPRTLHMSLLGLRDMSVIETPPKDRMAVQTVVAHFNADLIRSAIEQELSRSGQVYFVHNRVDTIYMRAAMIRELLPEVRIGVGHGQMGEAELEKVLLGFMKHEFDVFVCTTIVENGLDIPLANTILIENAERYGLSELYQLRGRVGRSNRRAYAYLMVPPDRQLSEIARKRLAALREFSDLGAGFKIAALDLELRGAGNLLGGEQHGQIESVGFDTYIKLLEEAVHELRGEEVPLEIHSTLNLGLDLRVPATYITDESQRLRAYKKIAGVQKSEDIEMVRVELADRYGPPPAEVDLLLRFALVKSAAQRMGVEAIDRRGGYLNIKFHEAAKVDPMRLMEVISRTDGAQFTPAGVLKLPVETGPPGQVLGQLQQFLGGEMARSSP